MNILTRTLVTLFIYATPMFAAEVPSTEAPGWNSAIADEHKNRKGESPLEAWHKEAVASEFSGAVLVARGQEVLFEKGIGFANKEDSHSFTADTIVDILSVTKQFTASAILKLEEQGALSVYDTLARFFEDVPEDKKEITLHQLLTHSSGLKEYYKGDYRVATRDQLERDALKSRLRSPPGEEYHYSNMAYSLLGIIIEKVSEQSYEEFLHEHFFVPAGMTQTGYRIPEWSTKNIAVGYRRNSPLFYDRWRSRIGKIFGLSDRWGTPLEQKWAEDGPWWSLHANGGLLSTLNDLHRWHLALEYNLVLSEVSKEKLYSPYVKRNTEGTSFYGYGWGITTSQKGDRIISHGGGNPYFSSGFINLIDDGVLILFASNNWEPVKSGLINRLVMVIENEYTPDNKEITRPEPGRTALLPKNTKKIQ